MIGGDLECRKWSPLSICRDHDLMTLGLTFLSFLRYALRVPEDMSSVIKTRHFPLP